MESWSSVAFIIGKKRYRKGKVYRSTEVVVFRVVLRTQVTTSMG